MSKEKFQLPQEEDNNLPIGAGKRSVQERSLVPFERVDNEVVWLNQNIQSPFDIEMGEPTNLGIFASERKRAKEKGIAEGMAGHGRTLIIGQALFKDTEGRFYRDVDVKGIGNLEVDEVATYPKIQAIQAGPPIKGTLGIFERSVAEKDASLAEEFLDLGIRTYRVVAITKLKELVNGKKKISIEEAKRENILPAKSEPVVSIRAFGTRDRVGDAWRYRDPEHHRLQDAEYLVAQELGVNPLEFSNGEYLGWFSKTLATNLARMHHAGFTHGYLTKHNITLDCRIVDLDSIRSENIVPSIDDLESSLNSGRKVYEWELDDLKESQRRVLRYRDDILGAKEILDDLTNSLGDFSRVREGGEPEYYDQAENFVEQYTEALKELENK